MFSAVVMMFFGIVFGVLAKFEFGRKLLENYPSIFSAGKVSKKGPSREVAENTNFVSFFVKAYLASLAYEVLGWFSDDINYFQGLFGSTGSYTQAEF